MHSFFSNKKLIVLLVSIIILVALIGFSVRSERSLSMPEKAIRDAFGWVQNVVAHPAHFFTGVVNNVQEMFDVYEENQRLKARLEEYDQVSVERDLLLDKQERLLEMLELEKTLHQYDVSAAAVIHRAPDAWEQYIGLNRGERDGVTDNMAVIDVKGGLVGKVSKTSKSTSYVQLLSDNDRANRVSATVKWDDGEAVGFVEGYDAKESLLIMRKVDMEKDIPKDTTVTTSGLGGIYPPGLTIGEVVRTEVDEYGLTQDVYIRPKADFSVLDYVYIVKRMDESLDPSLLEEEGEDE
ncbi:rod shape-determining protein MreC [Shouchella lonarensis]|uniref:Cell shape-determining protein MreC n=1 Tax=Shouchella lonarensis TaxID=1464122 RepID=A0A1G6GHR8_9BACI|nr:rod shape-determining protein MreC [Shouchella lonarensis]SDB81551.1 rod shape-determining protein MreC [Shouchella lonarensis]